MVLAEIQDQEILNSISDEILFTTRCNEYRVRQAVLEKDRDVVMKLRFDAYNALGYYGEGPGKLKIEDGKEIADEFENYASSFLLEYYQDYAWMPVGTVRIIDDLVGLPADEMYNLFNIRLRGPVTEASRWIVNSNMRGKSPAYLLAGTVLLYSSSKGAANCIYSAIPDDARMHAKHMGAKLVKKNISGALEEFGYENEGFEEALKQTTTNHDVTTPTLLLRWDLDKTPSKFVGTLEHLTAKSFDSLRQNFAGSPIMAESVA